MWPSRERFGHEPFLSYPLKTPKEFLLMKNILTFAITILCFACTSSFRISGKIDQPFKSQTVELTVPHCQKGERLLSAPINENGSFELKGKIPLAKIVYLEMKKDHIRVPFYTASENYKLIRENENYYILSDRPSSLQNRYVSFLQEKERAMQAYTELGKGYGELTDVLEKTRLSEKMDRQYKVNNQFLLNGIGQFKNTEIAQHILDEVLYYGEADFKFFMQAVEAMGSHGPDSKMKERILTAYEKCKAKQLKGKAPDFTLPDPEGRMYKLSDFRGKYVLLDFWASWCAPCRKKNKELNRYYEELKKNDLTVISISLDDQRDQWLEAVKTDHIAWLQLADLQGFKNSETRKAYKVEQVPLVYLINPQGNIALTNPTLEEIQKALGLP